MAWPQNSKEFSFTAQSKITHKNFKILTDKPGTQVILWGQWWFWGVGGTGLQSFQKQLKITCLSFSDLRNSEILNLQFLIWVWVICWYQLHREDFTATNNSMGNKQSTHFLYLVSNQYLVSCCQGEILAHSPTNIFCRLLRARPKNGHWRYTGTWSESSVLRKTKDRGHVGLHPAANWSRSKHVKNSYHHTKMKNVSEKAAWRKYIGMMW